MSAPSTRRTLFAAASAVVLGSGVTAGLAASVADFANDGASTDATLIAVCTSAQAADDRSMAVWEAAAHLPPTDARVHAAFDESHRIYEVCRDGMGRAAAMQPTTSEGWQAKASLALREFCGEDEGHLPLVHSILIQLAGRGA